MLPALSQSLRLKAGLNIPEVHVGKLVGFFFLMLKMVYYTENKWRPQRERTPCKSLLIGGFRQTNSGLRLPGCDRI